MKSIGKYQIESEIGVGGFGKVFKGYDPFIKRHIAIKTCESRDQDVRNRFFQEAEIAGNLHHRNVTTVHDFGIHDDLPYLIQEYLSGEDLDRKVKRRDFLPYLEKIYYLLQIARGLAYAHSKGVIHRDIKPANIRVLEDGTTKIMDFGIAKLAQQETGLTQTGMTLGTAAYLAPEQIRGESVDHRTDVFSLGVLSYELLTYERPFQGKQISAVLYQILNSDPKPITDYWPAAPPEIVRLIDRCLQKDPSRRHGDAGEVLRELEALQKHGRGDGGAGGATTRHLDPPPVAAGAGPTPTPSGRYPAPNPPLDEPSIAQPSLAQPSLAQPVAGPTVAAAAPAETDEAAQTGGGLGDIEIAPTTHQPGERTGTQQRRRSSSKTLSVLILLALAVLAAAAGWWLGTRAQREEPITEPQEVDLSADAEGDPAVGGDGETTAGAATEDLEPPADEPATEAPEAAPPPPVAPPPEPPPPAAPEPGTLVFNKPDWSDAIKVRIAGRGLTLNRARSVELEAGSYRAQFSLDLDGYRDEQEVRVSVGEGERKAVDVPILQPGALSVRAMPRSPQGRVLLGEADLGGTPLTRVRQPPGELQLQIAPRQGDGEPLAATITIEPGKETIVTFNFDAQAIVGTSTKDLP